jgi:hypothetical protein
MGSIGKLAIRTVVLVVERRHALRHAIATPLTNTSGRDRLSKAARIKSHG